MSCGMLCGVIRWWSLVFVVFFFKQKTAYEGLISDWSSHVCSSDLSASAFATQLATHGGSVVQTLAVVSDEPADMTPLLQSVATREGGIDAVFIALRGDQARAIAPQLAAAGLSYKPRVATSQLLSGTEIGRAHV